jgi:hypothetical protein
VFPKTRQHLFSLSFLMHQVLYISCHRDTNMSEIVQEQLGFFCNVGKQNRTLVNPYSLLAAGFLSSRKQLKDQEALTE